MDGGCVNKLISELDGLITWCDKIVSKTNQPNLSPHQCIQVEPAPAQAALACKGLHLWEMA